jgi:hypothetical protein
MLGKRVLKEKTTPNGEIKHDKRSNHKIKLSND